MESMTDPKVIYSGILNCGKFNCGLWFRFPPQTYQTPGEPRDAHVPPGKPFSITRTVAGQRSHRRLPGLAWYTIYSSYNYVINAINLHVTFKAGAEAWW